MFKKGAVYNRLSDIHAEFGGNQQSGIVPSPKGPYVFLFSSSRGEEYGYKDGWSEDGAYLYSGEGQYGNQDFTRGNRAIRDHSENGKELHLFERHGSGTYKYVGQFAFDSYKLVKGEDANGNERQLIKFRLSQI